MTDHKYEPRRHAAEPGALEAKLVWLRKQAFERPTEKRLANWSTQHLSIDAESLQSWCALAWWGVAAGELVRVYLYDRELRDEALALLVNANWSSVDAALDRGGAILAAAHLGPPKFGMNALFSRFDRPFVVTCSPVCPRSEVSSVQGLVLR